VTAPEDLSFDDRGLLPVIVQDVHTKDVLMLAYADVEAIRRTLDTGTTWFWSRSRQEHWNKGATSGNVQRVVEVRYDCDSDTVLVIVDPAGPACHTGERSCFFRTLDRG
jgi:phosphoribosyl-ATP pyrophosphohydrolase/phosphoribosyl-AMP cyclohydrolase